jgi:peptide chain release factor 2
MMVIAVKLIEQKIKELEEMMSSPDFWNDSKKAQEIIKELQDLKNTLEGGSPHDAGDAVVTIFAGAGGDDAEDFVGMLFRMYSAYAKEKNFSLFLIDEAENDQKGFRNLTFEIVGRNVYGLLKNESGVHRLVRQSPFNSKSLRQTSFAMVEVVPRFNTSMKVAIPETEIKIEFAKAGGPGGQNVNKRETAVRAIHIPTKLSVHVSSERSQAQNKEKALEMLKAKLFKRQEEETRAREQGLQISKTTENEWGSQIRSYVLHPYKMVKDHRTNVETSNVEKVLEEGDLDEFIEAEKHL